MKALSIRQPWAWLIVMGYKDIENRTWPTRFRGPFLIHAGTKFDQQGYEWIISRMGLALPSSGSFDRGGLVGSTELVGCATRHDSPWFSGPYGFILKGAKPLPFMPFPGKLGFFEVEEPVP